MEKCPKFQFLAYLVTLKTKWDNQNALIAQITYAQITYKENKIL